MSAHTFTTELVSERVLLGIYDPSGVFTTPITRAAEQQGLSVAALSGGSSFDDLLAQQCYKIVVALTPLSVTKEVLSDLELLGEYQEKIVTWVSVMTPWQEEVSGEVPHAKQLFSLQEKVIDVVNVKLSQSVLVLGQDVILPPTTGGVFDLLLQNCNKNMAFIPAFGLSPVGLAEFVVHALASTIRPDRISTLITGKTILGKKLVENIITPYEQYYFHQVALQPITGVVQPVTDFPLQEEVIASSCEEALKWYSRQLPSPHNWKSLIPGVQQRITTLEKQQRPTESFYSEVLYPHFETQEAELPLFEVPVAANKQYTQPTVETVTTPQQESSLLQPSHNPTSTPIASDTTTADVLPTHDQFDLQDEIQRIFGSTRKQEKQVRVSTLEKTEKKIIKTSKKRTVAFYGGLAFTGAGLGVLFLLLVFVLSTALLKKSLFTTLGQVTHKQEVSASTWQQLYRYTNFVSAQAAGYEKVVSLPQLESAQQLATLSTALQETTTAEQQLSEAQQSGFSHVMGNESQKQENSQNMLAQLLTVHESLATVVSLIESNTLGDDTAAISLDYLHEQESALQNKLTLFQNFETLWPEISGQTKTRNYAVVLQNNQELRPTGGIIEAFAILTMERGKLTDYTVYSSYELEGKTPGQVLAPEPIKRYLGEEQLFLYDANWNPDFAESSKQMRYFIEHASGKTIDGVLSLDMYGFQRLLEVTGPLDVPEFNEVITAENLFERLEAHPEVVLVNDGKNKDYRVVLLSHLFSALRTLNPAKADALLAAAQDNFADQSQQWFSLHEDEMTALQSLGWTGTVLYPKCPAEFSQGTCVLDSVYMVEANVGVNKANYYLERGISDTVKIEAEVIQHTYATTFTNTAKTRSWPKGAYKTYVRYYIPEQAYATQILVNGTPVSQDQLDVATAFERKMVGTLVEVPIDATSEVTLQYSLPYPAGTELLNYAYLRQRQAGSGATTASVVLEYAEQYSPTLIAPQAETAAGSITFTDTSYKTALFGVQLTSSQ